MTGKGGFQEHWLTIEPERMARYETMFEWSAASEPFCAAAKIVEGQALADVGCGPGHAAVEFARRVGPAGRVHALDINEEFVARARARVAKQGLAERITVHLLEDARLPLPDAGLDRMIARNTVIYVEDPLFTFGEFRRALKPGGIAHAIEGDWRLTAVEPVGTAAWGAVIEAASWAWPRPEIGRDLGFARRAGFAEVAVEVLTAPDTGGRLRAMIQTVTGYARAGGLAPERVDAVLAAVGRGLEEGTYHAISPQFVVTATA